MTQRKNGATNNDKNDRIKELEREISELRSQLEDQEIIFGQSDVLTAWYYPALRRIIFPPRTAEILGVDAVVDDFPECFVKNGLVAGRAEQFVGFYEAIQRGEPTGRNSTEMIIASGETRLYNRIYTMVYDAENQPAYAVISLVDITEKREQLLAAEKWAYISRSLKADNIHYYDYNMTQDSLESIDGNSPSIYPDQAARTFTGVAQYVATNIIHPDDREEYFRIFDRKTLLKQFKQGQTEIITEHRRIGDDGKYFHAQGVIQLYSDPFNGDVLAIVVIKNLDETIAIWKSKLNNEARELLTDSMPGGIIFVYNQPGHPFYSINRGLLEYLGYDDREELEAATQGFAFNFVHPDDRQQVEQMIREALEHGLHYRVDHRVLRKDGTVMHVIHRGHKNVDHEGREILVCLLADVTETVKLQEELESKAADLEERNRDLQTLTENVPGGVSIMRMDGEFTLTYANQTFFEMHGYTREQAEKELNFQWDKVVHPDDLPKALRAGIDARDSEKQRFEHEIRIVKRDKSVAWVLVRGTILVNDDESFIHSVTIDITKRKLYEEMQKEHEKALKTAAEAAEEATRMKSVFLANMSHEIRTPMNGVVGFAELALDDPMLSDKTRTYLNKIKMSGAGLLEIINDILDISKIEAGKMELDRTEFKLHDVFKQCETISGVRAEEKGIDLYFYSEPDLWKILIGDPTKLRQVLLNLLSNAIKFTNRGIVKLAATIKELQSHQVWIHFEVRDSGIGMSPEQMQKVFEPFTQADVGTTRQFGGTGLGLSITRSMIELMGGELKVESTIGIGSKFSFTLPFQTKDMPEDQIGSVDDNDDVEVRKPTFHGEVLVCEDNPINQDVICDHLSKVGLTAVVAVNGKVGVDQVKKRIHSKAPFDLIFMDIHMPVMDGLEATRSIIRLGVTTPIVALTANAMEKDRNVYLANGMSDYVAKPFRAQELWACLLKFLHPVSMTAITVDDSVPESFKDGPNGVIDRKLGLERAAGDVNLYGRVWEGFLKRNRTVLDDLQRSIDSGDFKQAHQIAHTLKGTAGLLGATSLSEAAQAIESALSEEKPTAPDDLMRHMQTEMIAVLAELESVGERKIETVHEPSTGIVDRDAAIRLVETLTPLLESANSKCSDLLNEIENTFSPLGDDARLLAEQIDEYDFEVALETLRRIHKQLES